jgi:Ca2+-binding RTX toxin-like protein
MVSQWVRRALKVTALTLIMGSTWGVPPAFGAPANDAFGSALWLGSAPTGTVVGWNVSATKEPGEPDHAGNVGGHSVWYTWTAPASGNAAFTTSDSDFDTLLAVYTGDTLVSLTAVAANDDDRFDWTSTVSFAVTGGTVYRVAVDGFSGKLGNFRLSWRPSPANDNFAAAQSLDSASSGSVTGDAQGATAEPGDDDAATVWYRWTVPADGTYKFDTVGSNFDTVLGVYAGPELGALTRVDRNDDDPERGCCASWVALKNVTAGTVYSIAVSPFEEGEPGSVVLNWSPLLLGTRASNVIVGTAASEEIRGLAGNDVLRGLGGDDQIFGGSGNDREHGGGGRDFVLDRNGTDRLFGNDGRDQLWTRDGRPNDVLAGGLGRDRCVGDPRDMRRGCP